MSYDQILTMLREMKLPIAYDHFAEGWSFCFLPRTTLRQTEGYISGSMCCT